MVRIINGSGGVIMRPENENTVLVYLYYEQTTNVTRNLHIKVGITFAH